MRGGLYSKSVDEQMVLTAIENKKIKVLVTITNLNIKSGGTSTCVYELARALNQNGCCVHILTDEGTFDNPIIANDSFIHTVKANYKTPFAFSSTMRQALHRISDYDVVHINGLWNEQNLYSSYIARKMGIPYIVSPHGMLYPQALSVKPVRKWIMRKLAFDRMLSKAACIQATCQEEKEHFLALGFTNEVRVIPNIIQLPNYLEQIPGEREIIRIGFLGRLHPIKNIPALLEAWNMLGIKTKEAELLIIGSGEREYEEELKMKASNLNYGNIHFCGFATGREKYRLLSSLRALCIPSHQENFGMTAIEALSVGTPVIATKTTPWRDLETYKCGWWVENNPESLAKAIEEAFVLNDNAFEKMGENGKLLVKNKYSPEIVVKDAIDMYSSVMNING